MVSFADEPCMNTSKPGHLLRLRIEIESNLEVLAKSWRKIMFYMCPEY
jgi:hypothetical protein